MIDDEYFTDTEQEEIRQFADKITPPNWTIWIDPKDFKYIPGFLNIHFWFLDDEYEGEEDDPMGAMAGPMRVQTDQK